MMMISTLMTASMMLSVMFTGLNHPMALGITLLAQTTLISVMVGLVTNLFWFSYILFLIFMGGMMVLFIYVASLSPNEMFTLSSPVTLTTMIPPMLIIFMMMDMSMTTTSTNIMEATSMDQMITQKNIVMKMYTMTVSTLSIIVISYLFLTLIVVVKITNLWAGPLRLKK